MHKLPVADDRSASGCTSCKSACNVNQLLHNFPGPTRRKLDALVISINEFNSSVADKNSVDAAMLESFKSIISLVTGMMEDEGSTMPDLENALTSLMQKEGGPHFKFLLEQVMG